MAQGDLNELRCMIGELWPHADLLHWRTFSVRVDMNPPETPGTMRLYVSRPGLPEDEGWVEIPGKHPGISDPFDAAREAILFCHIKRWEQAALGFNDLNAPIGTQGNRNAAKPDAVRTLIDDLLADTVKNSTGRASKDAICRRVLDKALDRLPENITPEDLPSHRTVKRWHAEMFPAKRGD